ncbi:MAG: NAD(P)/FAD-dependent oxidoreductase [Thermomicrobiales bacterium]
MADADIIIIGGGPAGHAAALRARELDASVTIIEEQQAGGNCVHHTCIPTTVLLDTIEAAARAQEIGFAGVLNIEDGFYWNRAVARKQQFVAAMSAGIRLQLRNRGVEFLHGRARLTAATSVHVSLSEGGERDLSAGAGVILATGARPSPPVIPGLSASDVLWADAALRLPVAPSSILLVAGGGAGAAFVLEFAQVFAGAGSRVTVLQPDEDLLPDDEPPLAEALAEMLRIQGIEIMTGARIVRTSPVEGGYTFTIQAGDVIRDINAETVCSPDSRVPYFADLGLEALGVVLAEGAVITDEHCATSVPSLYAAGDVTGPPMYSHVAAHQGRVAAAAALGEQAAVDLRYLSRVITSQPELATVGLTEAAAKAMGYAVRTGVASLMTNARALAMGQRDGIIKLVADEQLGQILGVHALGPGAADIVGLAGLSMQLQGTVDDLAAMNPWHPTLGESLVEAARRATR